MASNDSTKGNMICLSTFKSWGFNMFGVKTKKNDQDEYVYQVWCKICAANKDKIYRHQEVKSTTQTAAEHFINDTNFVTKHSVS